MSLLTKRKLRGNFDIYKDESRDRCGFELAFSFPTILVEEPSSSVIKTLEHEVSNEENRGASPLIWFGAIKSMIQLE